jgi:hypothetical protein
MKNKTTIFMILLMGALWGIAEATIGYALHFLPHGMSGMFMFPVGMYFMYNAYKKSNKTQAVLWVAMVAAMIKLIDLALPTRSPMSVLNPAISILLEGLVVFAFVHAYKGRKVVLSSFIAGLSWIAVFTLVQAFVIKPELGLYNLPIAQFALFFLGNAIVSAILLTLYLKNEEALEWRVNSEKIPLVVPVLSLVLALSLEVTNSLIF